MEHESNAFMHEGNWKLVGRGVAATASIRQEKWELYDLSKDRTELHNLANKYPDRVKEMSARWLVWANENMVYPKRLNKKK